MKNTATHRDLILVLSMIISAAISSTTAAEELPSMEFLEYLGEWETEDGEWIDPTMLLETAASESKEVEFVNTAEEQNDEQ